MWTWIDAHWWQILTVWSVANATILSPLSAQFPPTTWYGKILHVVVGFSPLDAVKALKALGTEAVPPTGP